MYVCICNAVTEADIKQAVEDGANCLQHLKSKLNVATGCGSCACEAKSCMTKVLEDQVSVLDLVNY